MTKQVHSFLLEPLTHTALSSMATRLNLSINQVLEDAIFYYLDSELPPPPKPSSRNLQQRIEDWSQFIGQ